MATKKQTVTITQNEEKPIGPEIIADAIVDISVATKKLLSSRLSKRALLLLIRDNTGGRISLKDIEIVLTSVETLEDVYVKRQVKK